MPCGTEQHPLPLGERAPLPRTAGLLLTFWDRRLVGDKPLQGPGLPHNETLAFFSVCPLSRDPASVGQGLQETCGHTWGHSLLGSALGEPLPSLSHIPDRGAPALCWFQHHRHRVVCLVQRCLKLISRHGRSCSGKHRQWGCIIFAQVSLGSGVPLLETQALRATSCPGVHTEQLLIPAHPESAQGWGAG